MIVQKVNPQIAALKGGINHNRAMLQQNYNMQMKSSCTIQGLQKEDKLRKSNKMKKQLKTIMHSQSILQQNTKNIVDFSELKDLKYSPNKNKQMSDEIFQLGARFYSLTCIQWIIVILLFYCYFYEFNNDLSIEYIIWHGFKNSRQLLENAEEKYNNVNIENTQRYFGITYIVFYVLVLLYASYKAKKNQSKFNSQSMFPKYVISVEFFLF